MADFQERYGHLVKRYLEHPAEFYHYGPVEELTDERHLAALGVVIGDDDSLVGGFTANSEITDTYPASMILPFFDNGFELKKRLHASSGLNHFMLSALKNQALVKSVKMVESEPKIISGISVIVTPEKLLTFLFAHRELGIVDSSASGSIMFRAKADTRECVSDTLDPQEPEIQAHSALMSGTTILNRKLILSAISPEVDEA